MGRVGKGGGDYEHRYRKRFYWGMIGLLTSLQTEREKDRGGILKERHSHRCPDPQGKVVRETSLGRENRIQEKKRRLPLVEEEKRRAED